MANIGRSISIQGDVTGDEDLVIDGKVEGRVELASHHLTIGTNGQVEGEVMAQEVTVVGRVRGDIQATDRIEISETGHVDGDLQAPRLHVKEGAVVNGRMTMGKAAALGAGAGAAMGAVNKPQPTAKLGDPMPSAQASPPAISVPPVKAAN